MSPCPNSNQGVQQSYPNTPTPVKRCTHAQFIAEPQRQLHTSKTNPPEAPSSLANCWLVPQERVELPTA